MICIALAVFVAGGCLSPGPPPKFPVTRGSCSAQPPGCGSAQGAARNLAGFSWSAAPAPPLSARSSQASVWTGTELLVWSGVPGDLQTPAADGAAYDPATRSWTPMPTSPLAPRDGAFAVWTGHRALFWGGGNGSLSLLMDGASYDPASQTWARMPASPLETGTDGLQAVVWTGTQMVVVEPAAGAAFDPADNAWTNVPALPAVTGWLPFSVRAEWTGGAVVAWVASRPPVVNGVGSGALRFDTYWWEPGNGSWTTIPESPQNGSSPFGTAAPVGGRLLLLGGIACPPGASCPAGFFGGVWFDPASGAWTGLADGYSGGAGPAVWTGSAMVVFGTKAGATPEPSNGALMDSADAVPAGATAAFDPSTGTWTDLAPCRLSDFESATVAWTGSQLIVVAMNGDTEHTPQVQVLSQ